MNNTLQYSTPHPTTGTLIIAGLLMAGSPDAANWGEVDHSPYELEHAEATYSFISNEVKNASYLDEISIFENEISRIYVSLANGQEPLGEDFEAVWNANLDVLYEA